MSGKMSFKKFLRKLGWCRPNNNSTSQSPADVDPCPPQPHGPAIESASGRVEPSAQIESPVTISLAYEPPQSRLQEAETQETMPTRRGREPPIQELWNIAYEKLRNEDEELVQDFENSMTGDLNAALGMTVGSQIDRKDWMGTVLKCKMEQVNRESWKLKFGSAELPLQEVVKPILGVVGWANDFISKAVSANPTASIAWGGVSLLLPLFLNPSEQAASLAKGLEYISSLIVQSYLWENLYERHYKSGAGKSSEISSTIYRNALEMLYQHVLRFQITSYRYYSRHYAYRLGLDSVKWNEWDSLFEKVKEQERVFADVLKACRDDKYLEECLAAEQRHKQVMDCWQSIGTDVSGLLKAVHDARKEDKRKNLLDWLWAANISVQYTAARSKHSEGTCEWLVRRSKDFRMWEKEPKSFLWLNGKAGSGKSILSSSVIKHLKDEYEDDPQTALAYHFFSFGNLDQQKVTAMLSSLVRQLCASRPDTPRPIKRFENYMARGERPDVTTLENALIAAVHGFSAVFIVVDALDECPTLQGERPKLLACLRRIIATMPDNLHIFCTSRAERDIYATIDKVLSLPAKVAIDLTQNRVGLNDDLRQYTESVLATETYDSWPEELKIDAKELLLEQADGMFQYLVCQFEVLQQCVHSEEEIRSALNNLPKGLDETYERLLLGVGHGVQPQVLGSLKWLALANRDLTLDELAEIFVFHPNCAAEFTNYQRLFKPEDVLQYFQSLVTIQKEWRVEPHIFGRKSIIHVRLAHFTVKDYLISSRIRCSEASSFYFTEIDAHLYIAHCCMYYHLHRSAGDTGDSQKLPLKSYAACNWEWHLDMVPRKRWTPDVVRLAELVLSTRSRSLNISVRHGRLRTNGRGICQVRQDNMWRRPYCYTAAIGSVELTKLLLRRDPGPNSFLVQEDLDSALLEAAREGNADVVEFLLNEGADANAQIEPPILDPSGEAQFINNLTYDLQMDSYTVGGALHAAAFNGDLKILQLLLDSGADVNTRYNTIGSVFEAAASQDSSAVLKFLLSRRVDVRIAGCPVLRLIPSHVTWKDHAFLDPKEIKEALKCLQLLLDNGVDINQQCIIHGTALIHAAYNFRSFKSPEIFDFLLQNGADVNLGSEPFGYPLQAACLVKPRASRKMKEIKAAVMRLLDMGADVNAQGGKYGNALQAACHAENSDMIRLLLDRGAEINRQGGFFGTAFQAACATNASAIVNVLLDNGADVDIQGGEYGNALQAACYGNGDKPDDVQRQTQRLEIVRKLLEKGVDVNATGGKFQTALQGAAASKYDDGNLEEFLLSKGADVNEQGGEYGTALQSACVTNSIRKVRVLLDHGAAVNIEGGKYGTALQAACARNNSRYRSSEPETDNDSIPGLLIGHGADVHAQGGAFGSAWHAAASRNGPNNETLKLLLDNGIDVNDNRGLQCGTALQAAFQLDASPSAIVSRVNFLLEHGADVNQGAGSHGFPLQSACMSPGGDDGLVRLLETCTDIDVNMTGGLLGTALQAAVHEGKTHAVRLLLNKGADCNIRGGKCGSALNAAIVRGYWDLVDILMDAGAEPDCHQLLKPDEEWIKRVREEYGSGAVERYKTFWEEKMKLKERKA